MKKAIFAVLCLLTLSILLISCSSGAYVSEAPPPPQAEVKPPAPTVTAVWLDGHWQWNGNRYIWNAGRWETKPKGTWVKGHWNKTARGHKWVPGHWKR